jgi:hypothetical protein
MCFAAAQVSFLRDAYISLSEAYSSLGDAQRCAFAAAQGNGAITWGWQSMAPMHLDACDVYGAGQHGGGGCGGGYTSWVWAAFSDDEGYRPEQCYPYAYR